MTRGLHAAAAAVALFAVVAGCAPLPQFRARWDFVEEPGKPDAFYVTILNEGRRSAYIAEVALDRRNRDQWKNEPRPDATTAYEPTDFHKQEVIFRFVPRQGQEEEPPQWGRRQRPGYPLIVRTEILGNPEHGCRLPVRLFIRHDLRSRRVQMVEISRTLPSALPESWVAAELPTCRDPTSETGAPPRSLIPQVPMPKPAQLREELP